MSLKTSRICDAAGRGDRTSADAVAKPRTATPIGDLVDALAVAVATRTAAALVLLLNVVVILALADSGGWAGGEVVVCCLFVWVLVCHVGVVWVMCDVHHFLRRDRVENCSFNGKHRSFGGPKTTVVSHKNSPHSVGGGLTFPGLGRARRDDASD
jgi:hypothetical protein